MQHALAFDEIEYELDGNRRDDAGPFGAQLLKWVGNKQRLATNIISFFPETFGTYFEPFLGSGGVLGTLRPKYAEASDCFSPLMEIWACLQYDPERLKQWYKHRWDLIGTIGKVRAYETVKASYNIRPNGADFVFLTRACYGGIVRFRKADGYMSTPCGPHDPVDPASFSKRVDEWKDRVSGTRFFTRDYAEAFDRAASGDLVYCDPPYSHSQAILYGAQSFNLEKLYRCIERAKERGVFVALSIDGSKKSGAVNCDVGIPRNLFAREVAVDLGRSMLRRLQLAGQTLENELVADRLLLTH